MHGNKLNVFVFFISDITGNTVSSIGGTEVTIVDCHKYISCISVEGIYLNYPLMSMDKQNIHDLLRSLTWLI